MRFASILAVVFLALACGSQESTTPEGADVGAYALEGAEGGVDQLSACIDEVANGNHAGAIPLCEKALELQPDNPDIQMALETARAATAQP